MQYQSFTFTNQLGEVLIGAVVNLYQEDGTTLLSTLYDIDDEPLANNIISNSKGEVGFKLPTGRYVLKVTHTLLTSNRIVVFDSPFSDLLTLTENLVLTKSHIGRYIRNSSTLTMAVGIPATLANQLSIGDEFHFKTSSNSGGILLSPSNGVNIDTSNLTISASSYKTLKLISKIDNIYDLY